MKEKISSQSMEVKRNATYGEIRNDPSKKMLWEELRSPEYWDYRRKWVEYPKRFHAGEFPLCLDIETTNVCNLDCVMCSRTILIARKTFSKLGFLEFDTYQKVI